MAPYPLNRLDDLVGETIERAVRAHHARRLRRRGGAEAIDPPPDGGWSHTADFAPRAGCRVEPFLDGAEALPRIADAIRSARSHVHLAGFPDHKVRCADRRRHPPTGRAGHAAVAAAGRYCCGGWRRVRGGHANAGARRSWIGGHECVGIDTRPTCRYPLCAMIAGHCSANV